MEALQSLQVRKEEENRKKLLGDRKKRDGPDDEMQARLRMELEHSMSISVDLDPLTFPVQQLSLAPHISSSSLSFAKYEKGVFCSEGKVW